MSDYPWWRGSVYCSNTLQNLFATVTTEFLENHNNPNPAKEMPWDSR